MARVLDAIDQALIEGAGGLSAFLNLGHDRLDEIVKAIDAAFSGHYLGHPANSSANIADLSTTFGRGDLPDRAASGPALGSSDFPPRFQKADRDQTHHFAMFFSLGINGFALTAFGHSFIDDPQDEALSRAAFPIGAALNDRVVHSARDRANEIRNVARRLRKNICK